MKMVYTELSIFKLFCHCCELNLTKLNLTQLQILLNQPEPSNFHRSSLVFSRFESLVKIFANLTVFLWHQMTFISNHYTGTKVMTLTRFLGCGKARIPAIEKKKMFSWRSSRISAFSQHHFIFSPLLRISGSRFTKLYYHSFLYQHSFSLGKYQLKTKIVEF